MIPTGTDSRGAILSFTTLATGAALGFLSNVLMAKILGPSGTGVIVLSLTLAGIAATVARVGLDNVVLRSASIHYFAGDRSGLSGLHRQTMSMAVPIGIVIAIVMWLATIEFSYSLDLSADLRIALLVLSLSVPASSFLIIQAEFLKALGRPVLANFFSAALLPALVTLGLITLVVTAEPTVGLVAGINTWAMVIAALVAGVAWRLTTRGADRPGGGRSPRDLLRAGVPFFWLAMTNTAMAWTDIVALGVWTDTASVGIYAMAQRVATGFALLLIACNSVTAPRFAALHASGNRAELQRVAEVSAFWVTMAGLPIIALVLTWPGAVMRIFGHEFVGGALALQILVAGQFVNLATGSVGYLLMMTGHERDLRNIVLGAAALNVVGNVTLVPVLGITGAATATAASLALMNIGAYVVARQRLGIDTLAYLSWRKLKQGPSHWQNRSGK